MRFSTLTLLALSFAPSISLASTTSKSVCQTKYGSKSSKVVPTSTYTHQFTQTVISKTTVIPSTTITPKTVTRTVFTDITTTLTSTAPQSTDTLYLTTTFDTTSTSSSTTTVIVTTIASTTITVDGGTTSVSTSAGFVPIQSVSGNPPARKRTEGNARRIEDAEEKSARSELVERASKAKLQCGFQNGHPYIPSYYPNSVSCEVNIKVITTKTITSTARKTITSTAKAPTTTITKTRSHTTSTLATPIDASTTIIVSTTMTYSATTIVTTTESTVISNTATATAAVATAYPGCAPNNFISSRNGYPIQNVYTSSSNAVTFNTLNTPDAVSCCQACQVDSLCGVFGWGLGTCYKLQLRTCITTEVAAQYQAPISEGAQASFVVGDGNCGQLQWDGITQ